MMKVQELKVNVGATDTVSALLMEPADPVALYVFAHGAGAGMKHPAMEKLAVAFADAGIATFRYNFSYKEQGRSRPDHKPLLHSTVRAAVDTARMARPDLPLFAGGKSMGGRMTSEAQALSPLEGVRGIVFIGFPLHPPKKPGIERAEHLAAIGIPMLFLQGTRDDLADLDLIREVSGRHQDLATLKVIEGADHSFHVLKRSGRTDAEVLTALINTARTWMEDVIRRSS